MGLTVNANLRFNFTEWLNANAIISYTTQNTEIEGYWGEKTFYAAKLRDTEYFPPRAAAAYSLSGEN